MTAINLEAATNTDWRQEFKVLDSAGDALSLSGATIRLDVRNRAGTAVLSLSVGSGLSVTDSAAGEFELEVDRTETADIAPGLYNYDLLIEINGLALAAARGIVFFREGVTTWPA